VDWLDHKYIQTKIIIQRNKNGNAPEKIEKKKRDKHKNTEILKYVHSWVTMWLMQRSKQGLLLVMHVTMH
jgi:hypothetical protein